ncbi:unnamed protein product, partial [Meganyctiphanes norvegica]
KMARKYKRKYKKSDDNCVIGALQKLREGHSYRDVSKETGIPRSTLFLYRKREMEKKKKFVKQRGKPRTLTDAEEEMICDSVTYAVNLGWPCHRDDVRQIIGLYCKNNNIKTPFTDGYPGNDFMTSFMKRNNVKISTRKGQIMKISRAKAESPEIISSFIDLIETSYSLAKIDVNDLNDAKRIYNLDETVFRTEASLKDIIVSRGGAAEVITPSEGNTNFSVLFCGNASGEIEPPYVIYKGTETSVEAEWMLNGPPGTQYNTTISGWMDSERFTDWLPLFDESLKKKNIKKPIVLLMDGHGSHVNLQVVEEAKKRDIILVKLPPNASHLLQALDVGLFGPLKKNWKNIIGSFYCQTKNINITKSVFPTLLAELFHDLVNNQSMNLRSGFRATGVWPLNKKIIMDKIEERGFYKFGNIHPSNVAQFVNQVTVGPFNVNEGIPFADDSATAGSSSTAEDIWTFIGI